MAPVDIRKNVVMLKRLHFTRRENFYVCEYVYMHAHACEIKRKRERICIINETDN